MNIAVVGTGYVGLVTGAVFADLGNDVVCVDKDAAKVEMLRAGQMPIYEPGLEELVHRNADDSRLTFTTDLAHAVRRSDIVFIAVGTPPKASGESDLSAVEEVALGIARELDRYKVIVNKSTVPVGTGDLVRDIITRNRRRPVDFDVVSNPEFLREGSAIEDTLRPDRIVIGAPNQHVAMTLLELYAPLERPMIITDVPSAEMIKYASNAFLATKISFINAIANLCEQAGADVTQVVKGMGMDPRIGREFLQPGLGYGGSCFPKDTDSLIQTAASRGYDFRLLRSVVDVNRERAQRFVALVRKILDPLEDRVVAVLGLAFKAKTDDMREARSVEVITGLLEGGARVRAYDPAAMANARNLLPPAVEYCPSSYEAAEGADAVAIVTEWNEFKLLNLERLRGVMRRPLIFDGRNIYEPDRMRRLGFEYHSIGRKPVYPA
jgi:UDPglucose 6-dehydrogenase